jgi:copper(I)-binding protein
MALLLGLAACRESPATPAGIPATRAADRRAPASAGFSLVLDQAWVEPAAAGAPTRAYLCFTSTASVPIVVAAVATPIAASVSLAGRLAAPRSMADRGGFIIPAHGAMHMHPGGTWLQLSPVQEQLATGDRVRLALAMPGELTMWVEAEVRALTVATTNSFLPFPRRS